MVISVLHPSRLHIQSINPSRSTKSIQRSNSIWTTHSNQSTKPWPFDAITSLSTPLNLTAAPRANKSPSTVNPRKTAITSQFACAAAMYRKGINNISGYTEGKRGETRASVFLHRISIPTASPSPLPSPPRSSFHPPIPSVLPPNTHTYAQHTLALFLASCVFFSDIGGGSGAGVVVVGSACV